MDSNDHSIVNECKETYPLLRSLGMRAGFLFANFFLIITALYQLKPASRSLFIEHLGADKLPYVWILTAVLMGTFITWYHRQVARHQRIHVVLGTTIGISVVLILFRFWFETPSVATAVSFYAFVDLLGVVLVEQFWSLANSIYTTSEGKRWYGIVGTGGLIGGVTGSGIAALLIKYTAMQTSDLVLSAAGTILMISAITWFMGRVGLYCEVDQLQAAKVPAGDWRLIKHNRYLLLIALVLLLAQLVSPIVEYQFMSGIESVYTDQEARTVFLSFFFSILSLVSIGINLGLTPIIHRNLGPIAGMLAQPVLIALFSFFFLVQSTTFFAGAVKISDRGLSYSINRASKELLYVPVDSLLIFRAKAWIDMLGYRVFKVLGSVFILLFTQWLPVTLHFTQLSWMTLAICCVWIYLVGILRREYHMLLEDQA